ncbi:MAG: hypothetical protein LBL48_03800 [Azoarcus sp.]|nr:hypothetical protein [Azoarcus sp.]
MLQKIHSEAIDVHTRLKELGLSIAALQEAVQQGYLSRAKLTQHHPRIFLGYSMWAETVAALHDNLRPNDWSKVDDNNYELTVNPDKTLAIAVTTGDESTGIAARHPSNKCPKGAHTIEVIETNQQLDFFPDLFPPQEKNLLFTTWVLLIHVAEEEIRAELSLPSEIVAGKIKAWKERIILPPLPREDYAVLITPPDILPPDVPEIDVPITRKA